MVSVACPVPGTPLALQHATHETYVMSLHLGEAGLSSAVGGLIGTLDNDVAQQVRIDLVTAVRSAG